jgi:glycosyltransferase involved in cell wall biosynthesis
VDSGSVDGSVAAAEQMGVHVVGLDLSVPFTAARARNEGFAALKSFLPEIRYVQFIDGDCELIAGWVPSALALLAQQPDVAVVCGRRKERHPDSSLYNRIIDDEWDTHAGEATSCGGDSIMRVDAFEQAGGFRAQLIAGEEPELCLRLRELGWKIWRLDADMTWHDIAMTRFSQWWARGMRSGYGCSEVAWLHWNSRFVIWKRETVSAVFWAGVVPLAIIVGGALHPALFAFALIYPLQIARMSMRRGGVAVMDWVKSLFTILDRFAAFQGILLLFWRRWRGNSGQLIEYK